MRHLKLIQFFNEISKNDVTIAGGKGASLGEMTQASIPVPNGFVILSESFEKFLEITDINIEINSILNKVNHNEMESIEKASEQIQSLIINAKMPQDIEKEILKDFKKLNTTFVAVRSSATSEDSADAAWAGQLDSFLNTKENKLLENVKRCWASLFTPRAIFYRFEKNLHKTKISVAVVVQKMVNSEVSGIAFSVHPVTQDYNQLIIEAGLGLGEAIVSGSITPDSYVITKQPREIIDKNISEQKRGLYKIETGGNEWRDITIKGKKQKLTDKQILELSEIILRIEKHYGFPCDIEWALEKNKFYIVQSRPITTLTNKTNNKEKPNANKKNQNKDFIWTKNYLENNSFDIKEAMFNLAIGEIIFKKYAEKNILGDSYNEIFIPHTKDRGMQIIPEEKMKSLERNTWKKAIKNKQKFIKILKNANTLQKKIDKISIPVEKLSKTSDNKLYKYYKNLVELISEWWSYASIGEDKGLIVEEKIVPLLLKNHKLSGQEAFEYVADTTMPLEFSVFSKDRLAFLDLCIKLKENPKLINKKDKKYFKLLNNYSKNYFYARTNFYQVTQLDLKNLIKIIKETNKNTSVTSLKDEYKKIINGLENLKDKQKNYKKLFNPTKEEKEYLWYFSQMQNWANDRKLSMMKHMNYLFNVMQELANRKKIPYETIALFFLEEIEKLLNKDEINLEEIKKRGNGLFFVYKKNKILRFYGKEATELKKKIPLNINSENSLTGTIASKGHNNQKVIGKVKIIHNPSKEAFNEGEVLVTTMTRPEFVPIMKKACAIITDEGGLTSHAAIVSRELGVACIIGTKNATRLLKNGDKVEVDANKGIVKLLKK